MPKLRTTRRAAALAAATLAIAGGTAIGVGGTAQAAPTSCTIGNIGNPGRISVNGYYAGEVEQQYDGCGNVRAHFQYDTTYWNTHSGDSWSAYPCVQTLDYHGQACATGDTVDGPQDVYSGWVPIHNANPDTWQAIVTIPNACSEAGGSWHAYASGANWGDYSSC
ncbi:hypothetical protein P3T37_003080 [Kitasatospora sp. MAA4]|uniref:hypothetical protein n=1 Tax=Kitasatospora sp. MAA4 TaxID=3035093 RepID=UPI0024737151|nr:hypothetical protein [Kitasatospora sp. MAA4]MDH6133682.1 hypothetical protein [Kitasatospora sp. MAA4]